MKNNHHKAFLVFIFISTISLLHWIFSANNALSNIAFRATVLFLIPLLISIGFKQKCSEIGLSIKKKKEIFLFSAALILISVPIMIYAAQLSEFQTFYPRFFARNFLSFLKSELLLLPGFFFLEFFYRGFALFQLKKYLKSDFAAVLLQNIPYFFIHQGAPALELYYSFFAGIVFGYVCLKAKSFLPAFFSHYTTSFIFDYLNW